MHPPGAEGTVLQTSEHGWALVVFDDGLKELVHAGDLEVRA